MEYEELIQKLDDPLGLKNIAPRGYDFLMAASLGPHSTALSDHQNYVIANMNAFLDGAAGDYNSAKYISIPLTDSEVDFNDSLSAALFERKSTRVFEKSKSTFAQLCFLLRMSAGIKSFHPNPGVVQRRMYPSGGGLYTLRIYVDIRNVEGIAPGVYLFNPFKTSLDLINDQVSNEDRLQLHNRSQTMDTITNSNFEILMSTHPYLAVQKYGEHGWKIVLMEMGHLAQNLMLVGQGCGFSMYPCTSLNLASSEKILRTSAKSELLLYSLIVGKN